MRIGNDKRTIFDLQPDALLFQRLPLTIKLVLAARLVDLQLVDIDQVRAIDRVGPAQGLVVAKEGERRSGEIGAREAPTFLAVHDQFIPGYIAAKRLV